MERKPYTSDLTDAQWQQLPPLLPPRKPLGRTPQVCRREIVNAILYVLRAGCAWRNLPHDFPDWHLVYHDFRTWRQEGVWERIHEVLRPRVPASSTASRSRRRPSRARAVTMPASR